MPHNLRRHWETGTASLGRSGTPRASSISAPANTIPPSAASPPSTPSSTSTTPQSWNGYAYANNNPVDHTDPTGLFCDGCQTPGIGVNCPPCDGGTPDSSPSTSGPTKCDSCNDGKGKPAGGYYPSKPGSRGQLVLDLSKMATPPLIRDLNRYFQNTGIEWIPLDGAENVLMPVPGYVPPKELSNLARLLITGAVVAGIACAIMQPCGMIAVAAAESVFPPLVTAAPGTSMAVTGTAAVGGLGALLRFVDDLLNGVKRESSVASGGAVVDVRKFTEYIFKADATHGKTPVFTNLGFSKESSEELVGIYSSQAADKYARGSSTLGKKDEYGQRVNIEIELHGVGAARGKVSYLTSGWMVKSDGSLTLNTPFSGFSR